MGAFDSPEYNELIDSLSFFGLDCMNSVIYLTLLERGPLTMSQLATKLEVDRGRVYRGMEKLVHLGIVVLHNDKVTTCEAVELEDALSVLIEKKKIKIMELKKLIKKISDNLEGITRSNKKLSLPTFSLVEGRSNIYARIGKLIQESTNPVYLITTTEDMLRLSQTAIPEKIALAQNSGIKVRVIVNIDNPQVLHILKNIHPEVRVGKLPSESRIVVEKGNQLLMSGSIKNTTTLNDESESSLYTNSKEIIDNMFSLCEQIWKKSKLTVYQKLK